MRRRVCLNMPMYPCACPQCGPVDVFQKAAFVHDLRCPECGTKVEQDYAAKGTTLNVKQDTLNANPKAYEQSHGYIADLDCHPNEVKDRRAALDEFGLGHAYQNDGTCRVKSRSEMRSLAKARATMAKRRAEGVKGPKAGWE